VAKKSNSGAKLVLTEGGSHLRQGKPKVERTSLRTLSPRDDGLTGVNRGTQAYEDLSAIAKIVISCMQSPEAVMAHVNVCQKQIAKIPSEKELVIAG
jgi:hypothetical protein